MSDDTHIRWLLRRDMDEVLEIERRSFCRQWSEDDYLSQLRKRNCIGCVAERDRVIVGFMIYELFPRWLTIIRMAVQPFERRSGVGTAMIDRLRDKLHHDRRTSLRFPVSDDMLGAHLWLQRAGFRATGVQRGRGSERDRYEFEWRLPAVFRETSGAA